MRIRQTDEPSDYTRLQRGIIRNRITQKLYEVTVGNATRLAIYEGIGNLPVDKTVDVRMMPERQQWLLEATGLLDRIIFSPVYSVGSPAAPPNGLISFPWATTGHFYGNTEYTQDEIYYGNDFLSVSRDLDLSPSRRHVVIGRGFYNQAGVPLFSVARAAIDSIGDVVATCPIVNDYDGTYNTVQGVRARFSPDGNYILSTIIDPEGHHNAAWDDTDRPAVIVYPWDENTETLGTPFYSPAHSIVKAYTAGTWGATNIERHPSGSHIVIGVYTPVEWTGSSFGGNAGLPPGNYNYLNAYINMFRWSRSGNACLFGVERIGLGFLSATLGAQWNGSSWGSAHADNTLTWDYLPMDACWSLDNTKVAIIFHNGVIASFPWDDTTGLGTLGLGDAIDTLTGFTTGGAGYMKLDPSGQYLAISGTSSSAQAVKWNADGTFGDTYFSSVSGGSRYGHVWYPVVEV